MLWYPCVCSECGMDPHLGDRKIFKADPGQGVGKCSCGGTLVRIRPCAKSGGTSEIHGKHADFHTVRAQPATLFDRPMYMPALRKHVSGHREYMREINKRGLVPMRDGMMSDGDRYTGKMISGAEYERKAQAFIEEKRGSRLHPSQRIPGS